MLRSQAKVRALLPPSLNHALVVDRRSPFSPSSLRMIVRAELRCDRSLMSDGRVVVAAVHLLDLAGRPVGARISLAVCRTSRSRWGTLRMDRHQGGRDLHARRRPLASRGTSDDKARTVNRLRSYPPKGRP